MQVSFPETVSDSLCINSSVMQTHNFISCPDNSIDEEAGCRDPGLAWLHVFCVFEAKFSKTMLELAYGRKMNITFSGNSSSEHSCSQHSNCTLPQNLTSVILCCVTKLHILEWPFIVPSTRGTCVMIMLFNQLLDMPHVRWMDYLGKGQMVINRDVNKFVHNILEK